MAPETRKEGRNAEDYCWRSYGLLNGKVRHNNEGRGAARLFRRGKR
jgi:hypothetical protein